MEEGEVYMFSFYKIATDIEGTGHDELDEIVDIAGYSYDPIQDIFISNMKPWQRYIGYCRFFDVAAAIMSMIIDSEPIYFEYGGKKWMVGIWKGQYALVTGGEIGFYKGAINANIPGTPSDIFYKAVDDDELLEMSCVLKKNGKILFERKEKHWWLTGFKLGEFSEPSELTMDITITLKDAIMREAFLNGMRRAGYLDQELTVTGNSVSFTFDVPRTKQVWTRTEFTDKIIQHKNKYFCDKYQEITGSQSTVQEKIKAIEEQAPDIYRRIIKTKKIMPSFSEWVLLILIIIIIFILREEILSLLDL